MTSMELDADKTVCNEAVPPEKWINPFGVLENKHMTVEDWQRRWELDLDSAWHMPRVHPMLQKHYEHLTQGKSDQRILVPLCGKSLDLNWLADAGHRVVGVEAVEKGVLDLFQQHQWQYEVEDVHGIERAKRFKRLDGRLEVWNVDLFLLNRERVGVFDGIWDRGSLVALNPKDRDKYFKVIVDLLDGDSVYLLDSFWYKAKPEFLGPPFIFEEDDIAKTLGPILSYKKLENFLNEAMLERVGAWGITEIRELVHLLRKKDQGAS